MAQGSGEGGPAARRIAPPAALAGLRHDILAGAAAAARFPVGHLFQAERDAGRLFLFLPVAMGAGILLYFAAGTEPWLPAPLFALGVTAAGAFVLRRRRGLSFMVLLALAMVFAGFCAASLRTRLVAAPALAAPRTSVVQGFVEEVDRRGAGGRLLLQVVDASGLGPADRPRRVRVTTPEPPTVAAGDFIVATARLMPPPESSRPGGYDFAREAFFAGIGAVGSVNGTIRLTAPPAPPNWALRFAAMVDQARNGLTERIARAIGGPAGAVAAALITGKRGLIPEAVNVDLRGAGIYHVVSISGLHMVLAAGMVFWLVRAVLALSPGIALGWPVKKIAALAGMGAALVYNVFAGSEIATERSLLMTIVLLGAILADRPALSMRNLAVAAIAVLALEPESLLGPSFQMSFAAVAALIALFESKRVDPAAAEAGGFTPVRREAEAHHGPPPGPLLRLLHWTRRHVALAILSTLVAEAATATSSLQHFQRLTVFGVIGNMLTLPLVSMVVMPAALAGILAVPFGLDAPIWRLMGLGVEAMLAVSARVAAFPGAIQNFHAIGPGAALLLSAAVVSATLWRHGLRWSAVPLALAGLAAAAASAWPDLVVAPDGRAIAIRGEDGRLSVVGRGAGTFAIEQWLRADADARAADDPSLLRGGRCDPAGCVARLPDGRAVSLVTSPAAFQEDCRRAAIVVTPLRAPGWCRPGLLIDRVALQAGGSHAVSVGHNGAFSVQTARDLHDRRPWLRSPPAPRPAPRAVGATDDAADPARTQ